MSSPNSPRVPGLIWDDHPTMPSVARFRKVYSEDGFFLICDPGGDYRIVADGKVTRDRRDVAERVWALVTALICAIWAATNATSLGEIFAFFIGGAMGGLILGCMIGVCITEIAGVMHRESDQSNSRKITTDSHQAWRLCLTVAKLAQVKSWADGTVDPTGRAPSILWSAVGRSMALDCQYVDATKALKHTSLETLAKETLSKIDRERQSLNAIEANLNKVLTTAIGIDEQRVQIAAEKKLAEQRRREEQELRRRLAGYDTVAAPQVSDTQADRSAGLAAETEVIADLLAESDRMLRESDS